MDRARELDSDKQRMKDMGSRDAAFCVNRGKCTVEFNSHASLAAMPRSQQKQEAGYNLPMIFDQW